METTQHWQWWWEGTELIKLQWQHMYCSECITQWIIACISTHQLSLSEGFKWIHYECDLMQSYDIIVNKLKGNDVFRINEWLNQAYFAQTNDILYWPKSGCDYIGFISNQECQSALNWEKWGYSWKLPSQMSLMDKSWIMIRNALNLHFETFSYLNDVFFGKPWPNCSIIIFKDGGWDKMTCVNCNHKFCWYCMGSHKRSRKSQSDIWIIPRIYTPILMLIWSILLAAKISIQLPDFITQLHECSEAIVEIASYIFVMMWCFVTLSIEFMLVYLYLYSRDEDSDDPEVNIKRSTFAILSTMYPIAWGFGFYLIFIQS